MTRESTFWDNGRLRNLLDCKSAQIRDFAASLGVDASTFFRRANFRDCDLRGQDLRGINLQDANLVGAIMDSTTLFDDAMVTFGLDGFDGLFDLFDSGNFPLLDRRESVLDIIKDVVSGVRLITVSGKSGVGKSTVLGEVLRILRRGVTLNTALPLQLRDDLRHNPAFVMQLKARQSSLFRSLISQIGSSNVSAYQRRAFTRVVAEPGVLSGTALQMDLFKDPRDLVKQVARLPPIQHERFLSQFFSELSRRFRGRPIIAIDDAEELGQSAELPRLMRALSGVQIILCGRDPLRAELAFDLDDRSAVLRSSRTIEGISWGGVKQLFDGLESDSRGAVRFPVAERERLANLIGSSLEGFLGAAKLGVVEAIARGGRLPVTFDTDLFMEVVERVADAGLRPTLVGTGPPLSELAYVVAIMEAGLAKGKLSTEMVATLLAGGRREADALLQRLVRRGTIYKRNQTMFAGSLCHPLERAS